MKILKTGVTEHPNKNIWFLVTENATYVIGVVESLLVNLHWGPRLMTMQDVQLPENLDNERSSQDPSITSAKEEFPAYGGLRYGSDVLRAEFDNHTNELDLVFHDSKVYTGGVTITLRDRVHTSFTVELRYKIDIENDLVIRDTGLFHTDSSILIRKAQTAAWHLDYHGNERKLTTLAGAWACETQTQTHTLSPGTSHLLQSVRGITSAQAYPYFAISDGPDTYFGTLAWSGNWSIEISTDIEGRIRIIGGLHDKDFRIKIGKEYTLPAFVAGYSSDGLSGARRKLTRHIASPKKIWSPVLFNGWEAYGFDVNLENQLEMANMAAKLGTELFVLDDGWFKRRNSDKAGLGDWYPDSKKFPTGLKPLSDHVHSLDMKFGIWLEPEMVNPDSDLYRKHPDWIHHYPDRVRHLERNQLVLNITRSEVYDHVFQRIREIVSQNDVDYIKWDMNRPLSEVGGARDTSIKHVESVYSMITQLKKEFVHLTIETCCSGGGRADMKILKLTDRCWASDNTRPDARLKIQHGTSLVMPPNLMSCWVTDMPNNDPYCRFPIAYRFHVSFMGALGIGSDLTALSRDDLDLYKGWISLYKELRPILQLGNLEFLVPPSDNHKDYTAVTQTTLDDSAVILAFRQSSPFWLPLYPVRLKNLQKLRIYNVRIWADNPYDPLFDGEMTGNALVARGLEFPYLESKQYSSVVVHVRKH